MTRTAVHANEIPSWFDDSKFGIFIHWTAAAIPAFAAVRGLRDGQTDDPAQVWRELPYAEMYQNTMAIADSSAARYHREHYGDLPFDSFVQQFRDELFRWDPEPWADLFARSGARYVVLVTKTEDGFLLWPSGHPNPHKQRWQADRDVVGELAEAVRRRGMRFGVYYSGGLDWTFGGLPVTSWEELLAAYPQSDEFIAYVDAHWRELIERYEPSVMWNDYSYPANADVEQLFAFYRKYVPDGVINDRFAERPSSIASDFVTLEYESDYSSAPAEQKWEACRGIGTSFGYNQLETDETYQSSSALLHEFVDVVARGGNFLLNVGPTAAGEVPWLQAERLLAIGWWLKRNGAAIYGTRRWARPAGVTADGLDVRYTASDDAVHAIVLGTPTSAELELDVRLDPGAAVVYEGRSHPLTWHAVPTGTVVELPETPDQQPAVTFQLSPLDAVHPT